MILTLLLFGIAWAEESGFELQVNPQTYSEKNFAGGLPKKVTALPSPQTTVIPNKEEREEIFAKVPGLDKEIASFDHLSRDTLFVRAKTMNGKELQKFYPKISQGLLESLHKLLLTKK